MTQNLVGPVLRHRRRSSSCSGPTQSNHGLGEQLVEARIREALRWLTRASEAGFLQDPANRDDARNDSDLAILANRSEFQTLINPPETKHQVASFRRSMR